MKKIIVLLTILLLTISIVSCSKSDIDNSSPNPIKNASNISTDEKNSEIPSSQSTDEGLTGEITEQNKILISYFTWADNTVVENPELVGVDAITSCSVLPPGNVAKIATWIQEEIGGDLFSIKLTETYSSNYGECVDQAADEKANNARPQLLSSIDNIDDYDVIFLGYPNWWSTAPMAIFSFIEEYDLSGKTVILFCSHGTGGLARSVRDITAALTDSIVVDNVLGVYRPMSDVSQDKVLSWLDELGY